MTNTIFSRNLFGRRRLLRSLVSPTKHQSRLEAKAEETLSTIEEVSSHCEVELDIEEDYLEGCVDLLSSDDAEENRKGLEKLLEATRAENTSFAIVYGGNKLSEESKLRPLLVSFLISPDNDDDFNLVGYGSDIEYDDDDDDDDESPPGKQGGIFHDLVLQIILSSLETVLLQTQDLESQFIDFYEDFWRCIIGAIVKNIETNFCVDITNHTLAILRQLHTLEPTYVKPFLSKVLFPYLVHLRDYGQSQGLPTMQGEASRLLSRTENFYDSANNTTVLVFL